MKDAAKLLGLLAVGLFTAVLLYPFLHEFGHAAAAILAGAKVEEFHLLPLPNVLCNMRGVCAAGKAWIGAGGIALPIVIAALPCPKGFWTWYIRLLLKGISLLAVLISAVSAVLFLYGRPVANEDITQMLQLLPQIRYTVFPLLAAAAALLVCGIRRMRPLQTVCSFFAVPFVRRPEDG